MEEDAGAGTVLISKSIHVRVMEECIDWMPCCVNGLMWHSLRNHGSLVKHGEFPVLLAEHMVLRDWLVRVGWHTVGVLPRAISVTLLSENDALH